MMHLFTDKAVDFVKALREIVSHIVWIAHNMRKYQLKIIQRHINYVD